MLIRMKLPEPILDSMKKTSCGRKVVHVTLTRTWTSHVFIRNPRVQSHFAGRILKSGSVISSHTVLWALVSSLLEKEKSGLAYIQATFEPGPVAPEMCHL